MLLVKRLPTVEIQRPTCKNLIRAFGAAAAARLEDHQTGRATACVQRCALERAYSSRFSELKVM